MDKTTELNSQKFIDFDTMKKIREHANLYDIAYDKKEFLKNVSVHEQKIILMNSSKPYEVLNYLDELDLKSSRLLLEELNYDEIKHIISLFSSEDKRKFYATFSDSSLVNQFIVQDENSFEHLQNLSFERKVNLIDSSDKQTEVATSVIYESMPYEERISAAEKVTDVEAMYTLEGTDAYSETQSQENIDNDIQEVEQQPEQVQVETEEQQEQIFEEKEERLDKNEEEKVEEELDEKTLREEQIFEEKPQLVTVESDLDVLKEFQQETNRCEQQEILNLINQSQQIIPDETVKTM